MNDEQINNVLKVDFAHDLSSAKTPVQKMVSQIIRETRRHKWSYETLKGMFRDVRRKADVPAPKKVLKLIKLPTSEEIKKFFDSVDDPGHKLIFKVAISTGVRIAELCRIRMNDIDLQNQTIFINQGKNSKDRLVVFPTSLKEELAIYMSLKKTNHWLFESSKDTKFSDRRLQQICKHYSIKSGIQIHFHLLRHIWNTYLAECGLTEDQRKVLAGHSKNSNAQQIYTHLSLSGIKEPALEALDKFTF